MTESDEEFVSRLNEIGQLDARQIISFLNSFRRSAEENRGFLDQNFIGVMNVIEHFYLAIPLDFENFTIFRSRQISNHTIFENLAQITYPHPSYVTAFGRCNFPGQSVFYGANGIETTLLEWKIGDDDAACGAQFQSKEGKITLVTIDEIDHFRRYGGKVMFETPGLKERIEHIVMALNEHARRVFFFVDAYVADFFRAVPGIDEGYIYEFTARFAKFLFDHEHVDGISYPSIRHLGGINVAIKPERFDKKFELVKFFFTTKIFSYGLGIFEFYVHTYGDKTKGDGELIWLPVHVIGGTPVPARATIPYVRPT